MPPPLPGRRRCRAFRQDEERCSLIPGILPGSAGGTPGYMGRGMPGSAAGTPGAPVPKPAPLFTMGDLEELLDDQASGE